MINSFTLRNYQSWKDVTLDLHPGINVILGSTDKGKSGLLRGFQWLRTNRPSGEAHRSWWGGEMYAGLVLPEGTIERRYDKKDTYTVNGEMDFTAFGKSVPDEVLELLNMTDINWQSQMDSHFLLSQGSADVARKLNSVANLDIIGTAQSNGNKQLRTSQGDQKTTAARLEEIEEELKAFEDLDDLQKRLVSLMRKEKKAEAIQDERDILEGVDTKLKRMKRKITRARFLVELAPSVKSLRSLVQKRQEIKADRLALDLLCQTIRQKQKRIEEAQKDGTGARESFDELMPDVCPLCGEETK